jgi:GT2 family glycosyltransferase
MTDRPLVTAILPSWNAAAFIHQTLASLDSQTYDAVEILVGDDASSDGTQDILRAWAATRPHVRLILRDANLGWVGNCNDLMSQARGEYMFFAFHDDVLEPDFVALLVQALQAAPDAVLAFGFVNWVEADGTTRLVDGREIGQQENAFARARNMIANDRQWYVTNHGLFRASAFSRIGGLKRHEAGEFGADFPWILHMALIGRFVPVPRIVCNKRMRGGNLSRSWKRDEAEHRARDLSTIREIKASDLPLWQKWWLSCLVQVQGRGRS